MCNTILQGIKCSAWIVSYTYSALCYVTFCIGKGVFCEKLPSLDRQTAEACFDEAARCGRPLVCGFYK